MSSVAILLHMHICFCSFIHSFIHSFILNIYIAASSRELLRGAPDSSAAKKSSFVADIFLLYDLKNIYGKIGELSSVQNSFQDVSLPWNGPNLDARKTNFIPGLSRTIRDSWSPCFHVLFQYLNAVFKLWPEPRADPRGTNPAMAPHPFWLWFPPTKNKHISAFNDLRLACKLGLL